VQKKLRWKINEPRKPRGGRRKLGKPTFFGDKGGEGGNNFSGVVRDQGNGEQRSPLKLGKKTGEGRIKYELHVGR